MQVKIEYDNDTGPNDEYFHEFWRIFLDGREIAVTSSEINAKLIAASLELANAYKKWSEANS